MIVNRFLLSIQLKPNIYLLSIYKITFRIKICKQNKIQWKFSKDACEAVPKSVVNHVSRRKLSVTILQYTCMRAQARKTTAGQDRLLLVRNKTNDLLIKENYKAVLIPKLSRKN